MLDDDGTSSRSRLRYRVSGETRSRAAAAAGDPVERAYVASFGLTIACEIHPLNNLRVLRYLVRELQVGEERRTRWYRHWVEQGLAALETRVVAGRPHRSSRARAIVDAGRCRADPADFQRATLRLSLDHVPTLMRIFEHCMQLPAFIDAQASRQPDAE